ncbi:MAG: SCP2 sterol-binding domain-containing protein [Ruminococcaceae bacterium]|nr:SCP2 sterol-binding domain-containing protein [Oscillospiraceae bacterium]
MTYEKIFSEVQKNFKKAKISNFTREFAFQFNITGDGEGIFYAAYKNGVLSVEPYDYQDRDVIFTADGKTITDIASGKLEPIDAINGGKLFVDGNQDIAKEIMLLINHKNKAADKPETKTTATKTAASTKKAVEKKTSAKAETETKSASTAKSEAKPAAKSTKPEVKVEVKAEKKADEKSTAKAAPKAQKAKTSKK